MNILRKALAQIPPVDLSSLDPLRGQDFTSITNTVVDGLIAIGTPVAVLMILIGGFQMLASGGNEEKFKSGKQTVTYALIGYGTIWLAKGAVTIIKSIVGAETT